MGRFWKTWLVMGILLVMGLAVGIGILVERDGRALVMACLLQEGDGAVLDGIRMSGVLVDRDARTPFAQGFEATGPDLQITEAWQRRIKRTEYRNSTPFWQWQTLLTDEYEYRLQVLIQPATEVDRAIAVTRTAVDGRSETAFLEGTSWEWRLIGQKNETLSSRAVLDVLEVGEETYLLLPLDRRGDSWIYRIDAWGAERDRAKADERLLVPLAVVPRSLGNRLAGFFMDGDSLLVVAVEEYTHVSAGQPKVDERVLLYRFGLDGSPVDQTVLPTGEGKFADVVCADGMLFVTMIRPADGSEVCVFTLDAELELWGSIPLDNLYLPLESSLYKEEDRAYRVIDGRLVFAWSEQMFPVRQSDSNTWVYPDGLIVYDHGDGFPTRQAIQLMVYEQTGDLTYRGLFDPGLSQDTILLGMGVYYGTVRSLARLSVEEAGP